LGETTLALVVRLILKQELLLSIKSAVIQNMVNL